MAHNNKVEINGETLYIHEANEDFITYSLDGDILSSESISLNELDLDVINKIFN